MKNAMVLVKRIRSEGLAHYSYLIGDRDQAVIIDPRRDVDRYIEVAFQNGMNITHVLETHRNEDYVIGSLELEARTGAQIWHAEDQLDYGYGELAKEGQKWSIGRLKLEALDTPGHTLGSKSYLLYDPQGNPWMVFCGDVIFSGDVGRIDFYGEERLGEMASKLYDSIFNKLLPLGDGIILCPAHGEGSACGESIAEREWTTIGFERERNPKLQVQNEKEFVDMVAEMREYPPYFAKMEKLNLEGPTLSRDTAHIKFLDPHAFEKVSGDAVILDTRTVPAFASSHIPGSLSIWLEGVPGYAGWFLPYDKPILLVGETTKAVKYLRRMGYDQVEGYLSGGMQSWHVSGRASDSIDTVTVQRLCGILDAGEDPWILDVRSSRELKDEGEIPGAEHIHITQLPGNYDRIPLEENIYIFCGSGLRSMTAASLLKKQGYGSTVVLGGTAGWKSNTCPLER